MAFAIGFTTVVVVGGTIVALAWWRLADRVFPRAGPPRPRAAKADRRAGATVVRGFESPYDP